MFLTLTCILIFSGIQLIPVIHLNYYLYTAYTGYYVFINLSKDSYIPMHHKFYINVAANTSQCPSPA